MKTFAFDVDGTILDSQKQIDKNVFAFFENQKIINHNIMFISGNTPKILKSFVKKMLTTFPYLKNKKFYTSLYNGAIVLDPNGKEIYSSTIPKIQAIQIIENLQKLYNIKTIAISDKENTYIYLDKNNSDYDTLIKFKERELEKKDFGLPIVFNDEPTLEYLVNIEKIYEINIFISNSNPIIEYLRKILSKDYLIFYNKKYNLLQISKSNKWIALEKICKDNLAKNNIYNLPNDPKDIIYFGDNGNDIICFQNCKLSFARGDNIAPEISKYATKTIINLRDIADSILDN